MAVVWRNVNRCSIEDNLVGNISLKEFTDSAELPAGIEGTYRDSRSQQINQSHVGDRVEPVENTNCKFLHVNLYSRNFSHALFSGTRL